MIIVQYLLDAQAPVTIPAVTGPRTEFSNPIEPVQLALDQEKAVTGQIQELAKAGPRRGRPRRRAVPRLVPQGAARGDGVDGRSAAHRRTRRGDEHPAGGVVPRADPDRRRGQEQQRLHPPPAAPSRPFGCPMRPTRWWQTGVVYQVYPAHSVTSNGDGVGDLEGIRRHLDYLEWLGVDAIWISPFYRSPMKDFGYDVADYTDVDPLFGDLAAFDRLMADAHARGLRVVVDYVPNHTSDQHPWFVESRHRGRTRSATGMSGVTRSPTAARRTTGSTSSAAPRGRGTRPRVSTTSIRSSPSSPISTGAIPR